MNFDLNDEQQEIKRTAKEFLASRFKPEKVRELAEAAPTTTGSGRRSPSSAGPASRSPRTTGARDSAWSSSPSCSRSRGYACAPDPLLGSAGAALVISAAGSDEQRAEWLPKLASGEATGSFGGFADGRAPSSATCPRPTSSSPSTARARCSRPASEVDFEPFEAIDATRSYGTRLRAGGRAPRRATSTPAATGSPSRSPRSSPASRQRDDGDGRRVRARAPAVRPPDRRLPGGRATAARRCCSPREESRSLTYYAAWTADAEPESLPLAAAMAGARAADAGWEVPASALQVFGGIGFTWEHDLQFWLKRGRVAGPHARHALATTASGSPISRARRRRAGRGLARPPATWR